MLAFLEYGAVELSHHLFGDLWLPSTLSFHLTPAETVDLGKLQYQLNSMPLTKSHPEKDGHDFDFQQEFSLFAVLEAQQHESPSPQHLVRPSGSSEAPRLYFIFAILA